MNLLILEFFIIFLLSPQAQGIEFELYAYPLKTDCFGESLNENTLIVGELRGSGHQLSVKLYDPNGKTLFSKANETVVKLSTTSHVSGTYQICIENLSIRAINYVLKIETGVFAKDYSETPQTKNLKPIEMVLKKTEDIVKQIQGTTSLLISRKEDHIQNLDFVNLKIIVFSLFTIVIMVMLSVFQGGYLKYFFKSKKLL